MNYFSKEIKEVDRDRIPSLTPCHYRPCQNRVSKVVQHLIDGDVESFYFVCSLHERYEDGSRTLGT